MPPAFEVYAKVARPVAEVFDAVHDPKKLSGYFTTGGAEGALDEGATVTWDFHDFPGRFPVRVTRMERDRLIELAWQAADGEYDTHVRMTFEPLDRDRTKVTIAESGWRDTEEGRKASYGNCMGWSQMLCALKAYVEWGKNLREGMY